MVRFILNKENRFHVGQRELCVPSWLSIPDRAKYFRLSHVFKAINGCSPIYLSDKFGKVCDRHSYNTRDCNLNFVLPRAIGMMGNSFVYKYNAIKDWNGLPAELKSLSSMECFKSRRKSRRKSKEDFLLGYSKFSCKTKDCYSCNLP